MALLITRYSKSESITICIACQGALDTMKIQKSISSSLLDSPAHILHCLTWLEKGDEELPMAVRVAVMKKLKYTHDIVLDTHLQLLSLCIH